MSEDLKKQFPTLTDEQIVNLVKKGQKADERTKLYGARKRISDSLYVMKAKKAGIKVTKEEVEKEMKRRGLI